MVSESRIDGNIIEASQLKRSYRVIKKRDGISGALIDLAFPRREDVQAVKNLTFSIQRGEIVGLVGPNGAGKSTTIKILTGIIKPTDGKIQVLGLNPHLDRKVIARQIGVVFGQRSQLWWDIAVKESFNLLAKTYFIPKDKFKQTMELVSDVLGLDQILDLPVRKLSLGQRMRCEFAASLLHQPKILFLDEPTIGLDTIVKKKIREFLKTVNREIGTTIVLTTHDLLEVEEICERVIVVNQGELLFDGALTKLRELPGLKRGIVIEFSSEPSLDWTKSGLSDKGEFKKTLGKKVVGLFDCHLLSPMEIISAIPREYEVIDLKITEPSMEEIILEIYDKGSSENR